MIRKKKNLVFEPSNETTNEIHLARSSIRKLVVKREVEKGSPEKF